MAKNLKSNYRERQDKKYLDIYKDHQRLTADPENQRGAVIEHLRKKYEYGSFTAVYYAIRQGKRICLSKTTTPCNS